MSDLTLAIVREDPTFREAMADALRYWEPRRIVYNIVLLAVVGLHFYGAWPNSKDLLLVYRELLSILAVLANALYCVAYVLELIIQLVISRVTWVRWRAPVLVLGTTFSIALTHLAAAEIFYVGAD